MVFQQKTFLMGKAMWEHEDDFQNILPLSHFVWGLRNELNCVSLSYSFVYHHFKSSLSLKVNEMFL